ncbi:MAG: hypothetical protein AAGC55_01840 [Myxococcota bacterium]
MMIACLVGSLVGCRAPQITYLCQSTPDRTCPSDQERPRGNGPSLRGAWLDSRG